MQIEHIDRIEPKTHKRSIELSLHSTAIQSTSNARIDLCTHLEPTASERIETYSKKQLACAIVVYVSSIDLASARISECNEHSISFGTEHLLP